jgi:hypothetical protein
MKAIIHFLAPLLLLVSCGELVHPDTYQGNRTIGPGGGVIELERLRVEVPRDILDRSLTFRLEAVAEDDLPAGALGPAYRLLPAELPGSLMIAGLRVTYRFALEELPPDLYFVELSVARLEGDHWQPLDAPSWDPLAGEITGYSPETGVFSLVSLGPDAP